MSGERVSSIGRLITLDEPVLIAPHGSDYHEASVLTRSWAGPTAWSTAPRCRAHAERWVPVDRSFAEQLGRRPCAGCTALDPTITDAEEAPDNRPEIPGSHLKGTP